MKTRKLILGCAVMAMTFAGGAAANEIYRWVDAEGNVHYGDRPSGVATEERLQLSYARTDGSAVEARVEARREAKTARDEAKAEAEKTAQEAAEEAEIAAEQQKACESARASLETYRSDRRLYKADENGERVYLDDEQRQQASRRIEQRIAELCN
ncbi:MAG: DUF4124 domain-containing protein [Woeseiaceae bacterium]|nr:DUF4124 domain-containing protein [Woeseiaceae bacterium]